MPMPTRSLQAWDPDALADTSVAGNQHRHKLSPYNDMELFGDVNAVIVGGYVLKLRAANKGLHYMPCGQRLVSRAA
jgi:allantoinase